ncbi:hypothetical protein SAMN04488057_10330 [Cyclobacterium lianum]|uniref:Uncharacterized protein n=1 Tax=Cyclobacterium lianum TaxID=388280 RepID=A0A1M7KYV9_9BACT|nr:hypothetical protein [Cyclobacterium lianum]SHM70590.1 hypothetical protein SAMN04488057_10330 [Cyclobacterium lianum]
MYQQKISQLIEALNIQEIMVETDFNLPVNNRLLEGKGKDLLREGFSELQGSGPFPTLRSLKIPVKVGRNLLLYDDTKHFNRYRLCTLKTSVYQVFSFSWHAAYLRMCRTHERECLLSGLQDRVWQGPPMASNCFGTAEEAGDLSGNGSPGWKLNAYNDLQYDLISRLHGFRLLRIPAYENLMISGQLQRIDKLLLNPNADLLQSIGNWLVRKMA